MSKTETCKYNAQSRMSEAKTKGQMLNVGCEKMNVHSTVLNLKVEFENLTVAHEKLNVESENLNVAYKSKFNVECKKVESRVQTQMTNMHKM